MSDPRAPGAEDGFAFFGKVVAGQSHELTNVLNIIHEIAGLQMDLLAAKGAGEAGSRMEALSAKVVAQVKRGEEIVRNVNRFAHCAIDSVAVFDVAEVLNRTVFLAERWARLAGVGLSADCSGRKFAVEADPFLFMRAVFLCIDAALPFARDVRSVTARCAQGPSGPEISVESGDPMDRNQRTEEQATLLASLVDALGGSMSALPWEGGSNRFAFTLPGAGPREAGRTDINGSEDTR